MLSKGQTEHFMFYQKRFSSRLCRVKRPIPVPFFEKNTNNRKKERIKPQFKNGNEKVARQVCSIFNSKTYNNVLVYTPLALNGIFT